MKVRDNTMAFEDFSDEDGIPVEELRILRTLTNNSIEDWPNQHSRTILHTLSDIASHKSFGQASYGLLLY